MNPNPKPYEWDFDGACAPADEFRHGRCETFSLGIFQWIPTRDGKRLKRGKVVERVRGYTGRSDEVFARARQRVKELNAVERKERS